MKKIASVLLVCFFTLPAYALEYKGITADMELTVADKYLDTRLGDTSDKHSVSLATKLGYSGLYNGLYGTFTGRGDTSTADYALKAYSVGGGYEFSLGGFGIDIGFTHHNLESLDDVNEVYAGAGFETKYLDLGVKGYAAFDDVSDSGWIDAEATGTLLDFDLTGGASYAFASNDIARYYGVASYNFSSGALKLSPFVRGEWDDNFNRTYNVVGVSLGF